MVHDSRNISSIWVPLTNNGEVNIQRGVLQLYSDFISFGVLKVLQLGSLELIGFNNFILNGSVYIPVDGVTYHSIKVSGVLQFGRLCVPLIPLFM